MSVLALALLYHQTFTPSQGQNRHHVLAKPFGINMSAKNPGSKRGAFYMMYVQCIECGARVSYKNQYKRCKACYWKYYYSHVRKAAVIKPANNKEWVQLAVPIDCAWCLMTFEVYEPRVETEDDNGFRVDYHQDCFQEVLEHE